MSPVLVGRTVLQEMVNFVELVFMGQAVVFCPGGSDSVAGDGQRRRTRCSWVRLLSSVLVGRTVLQEMVHRRTNSCLWARLLPSGRTVLQEMVHRRRTRVCGPGCCLLSWWVGQSRRRWSTSSNSCLWARLLSSVLVGRTVLQEMVHRNRTRFRGPGCCFLSWWIR